METLSANRTATTAPQPAEGGPGAAAEPDLEVAELDVRALAPLAESLRAGWGLLGPLAVAFTPRAYGVSVDEEEVTVCAVGPTCNGARPRSIRRAGWRGPAGPAAALRRLLAELPEAERQRAVFVLGVPAWRVLHRFRPVEPEAASAGLTPELVEGLVGTRTAPASAFATDGLVHRLLRTTFGHTVSCRKEYLQPLLEALVGAGVRRFRFLPTPFSLLAMAQCRAEAFRDEPYQLHVFVGAERSVALTTVRGVPVALHGLDASSPRGLVASVRTLESELHESLTVRKPGQEEADAAAEESGDCVACEMLRQKKLKVLLYGTGTASWEERIALDTGLETRAVVEDWGTGTAAAFCLGAAASHGGALALDLAKTVRPSRPLRDLVPRRDAGFVVGLLLLLTAVLGNEVAQLRGEIGARETLIRSYPWAAGLSDADLSTLHEGLGVRVQGSWCYFSQRVVWSEVLQQLPPSIPRNVWLTKLRAECEFKLPDVHTKERATPPRRLELAGSAAFPSTGSAPREIDALLGALRKSPVLTESFAKIEVSTLTWRQEGNEQLANFVIKCGGNERGPR
ncbi:MAG: PilN domain-containing protein [Planctomycetes bacterium]|nr:PilN domain-containing protein [Planctomycetota bacterium]